MNPKYADHESIQTIKPLFTQTLTTLQHLCGTSESHFVDVHVAGNCCSCCRTKAWNDVHNSRRKPCLQNMTHRDSVQSFKDELGGHP